MVENSQVTVRGIKGQSQYSLPQGIAVSVSDKEITVSRLSDSRFHRSQHGLVRTLLANMVQGVSQGFEKGLEMSGVGYRVQQKGGGLVFQLGFSHPVELKPPPGVTLQVVGSTGVRVLGSDKAMVGEVAARIRALYPPDPYKGKGIRYAGETVRLKPGKAGKAAKKL